MQLVDDSDGSVAAAYEYDPYGNIISKTGAAADDNPFRFSTKYWDDESGLGYWGYRYYHPGIGRWISRDPIAEQGGLNLYGYVGNEPVGKWDYLGLKLVDTGLKVCSGYIKGDIIFNNVSAHSFVTIDGVGYGFYADSHAGGDGSVGSGDWEAGLITPGKIKADDQLAYPPTSDWTKVEKGKSYSICKSDR